MTAPLRAGRLDTLWCGLAALLVYVALRQETLYSVDAHGFLLQTLKGGIGMSPTHFSYMPLLALCRELAASTGTSLPTIATLLSAFGTAVGVMFVHAANRRLGLSRVTALWATGFVALAPAVVFFATVIELPGQHFGLCGPAFLATAAFAERPNVRRGIWLGLATGLGYAGHATGSLLPAMTVPIGLVLAVRAGADWRRCLTGLAVAVGVHGWMVIAVPLALRAMGFATTTEPAAEMFGKHMAGLLHDPAALLDTAWRDWLRPFVPIAAVALAAVFVPRVRALALALSVGVFVYVVIAAALLVPFVGGVQVAGHETERGAYLLPLAWPAGLVVALACGRNWLLLLLLLSSAGVAVFDVKQHDQRGQRAFAEGFREVIGTRPVFVLTGTHDEIAAFLLDLPERAPDVDWLFTPALLDVPPERAQIAWNVFDELLRGKHAAGIGLWITVGGVETLTLPGWTKGRPAAALLLKGLRDGYAWEERRAYGFAAWRLVPRPR